MMIIENLLTNLPANSSRQCDFLRTFKVTVTTLLSQLSGGPPVNKNRLIHHDRL